MKRLWLLFIIACYSTSNAQIINTLKGLTYETAATNYWTAELHFMGDSLVFDRKKNAEIIDIHHFAVAGKEVRGAYQLFYVKQAPYSFHTLKESNGPAFAAHPSYSLIVLSFSEDKQQLLVLHLTKSYHSIEEVKNAYANAQFDNMFFITWYSPALFNKFGTYPDVLNADKSTIQQIISDWKKLISGDEIKIKNGHGGLSVDPAFNLLGEVLVEHHLNPAGITDMDKMATTYHLQHLLSAQ